MIALRLKKYFFTFCLGMIPMLAFGQSKHVIKIGVEPYYYYFSLKEGHFTNSLFTLTPTFEYNYKMKNFDFVFKRTVHRWYKETKPLTTYLADRLTKNYTLGVQKKIIDYNFISLTVGSGLVYFYGGDIYKTGNSSNGEDRFSKFGAEIFGRCSIQYAPDLTIEPSFSLHLSPSSTYNGYSFIILLGYGF